MSDYDLDGWEDCVWVCSEPSPSLAAVVLRESQQLSNVTPGGRPFLSAVGWLRNPRLSLPCVWTFSTPVGFHLPASGHFLFLRDPESAKFQRGWRGVPCPGNIPPCATRTLSPPPRH